MSTEEKNVTRESAEPLLEHIASMVLIALAFLLPIFFIPTPLVSLQLSKSVLLTVGVLVALILWILSKLKEGSIMFPTSWLFVSALAIPLVYLLSALFSSSVVMSLVGQGIEVGTFTTVFLSVILMLLIPVLFKSRKRLFYLFLAVFASLLITGLFQILRLIFGSDFLSFGILTNTISNLIGKWNDLGIFFGLGALTSVMTIELLNLSKAFKILSYTALILSLFFLSVVDFSILWFVIGIFGFILLVYFMSAGNKGNDTANTEARRRKISGVAIALIVIALVFIVSGGSLSSFLSQTFNISQIEARPSWGATFEVAQQTLSENPLLGVGPNRFVNQWLLYKPDGINETLFWNIDFNAGIGFIPSTLVTVGILGFVSWLVFFAFFLLLGFKALFAPIRNSLSRYLINTSFLGSLYLWILTILYIPNIVMFSLSFLLTGIFLASAYQEKLIPSRTTIFTTRPSINFASVLISIMLIIAVALGGYFVLERFIASIYFGRGITVLNSTGNLALAEANILRAINLSDDDRYYQLLSNVRVAQLNVVLSQQNVSEDIVRSQFQTTLAGAIDSAQIATSLGEENYQNWVALGLVYESIVPLQITGAYESAKVAYERARKINPTNPALLLRQARLEIANGNITAARDFIAQSLVLKNNYTEAIFLLSQIEVSEGNIQNAIQSVEAASLIAPNDPTVFFRLGLLRYNDQNYRGAISALETAVALNPIYANAKYFLGLSYYQIGRTSDAIQQFESIEEFNPNNQEVKFILSNLRAGRSPFVDAEPPIDDEPESRDELPIEE